MENKEIKDLLHKSALRLPTSAVIMTRILSNPRLQHILKKLGTGRPIVVIYGEPGNGKTSSVRALLGECHEIKFANGLKEVKKLIKDMADKQGEILFLDNFPQSLSEYKQEAGRRILDYVIDISSEDEQAPMVVITGEPNILEEIKKVNSLLERTLVIKMPKIDGDGELYEIRKYFSLHQTEYLKQWKAYDRWDERNPADESKILQELERFQKKYCKDYAIRQIRLVFCYFYAIRRFSKFLEAEYGEEIMTGDIEDNVQALFDWEKPAADVRLPFEIDVWNEFVEDCGLNHVLTPRRRVCPRLVQSMCNLNGGSYECYRCDEDRLEKYNPMDLRLPQDFDAAILLENPKWIPNFSKHIACKSPLLMISKDALLDMLNTYLEAYGRKKGASVRRITAKKFTKEMFSHNLCLYEYVGENHNTYTFGMKNNKNEDVRVIFIKLTEKQYQKLQAKANVVMSTNNYARRDVEDMNRCMKYFCKNVQSLVGDIGTPSMVQDD